MWPRRIVDRTEKQNSKIIHIMFDLVDTDVSEVMCPRAYMDVIAVCKSLQPFLDEERQGHYSRMPVLKRTMENALMQTGSDGKMRIRGQVYWRR